jgi:TolA-binding protein
VSLRIGVAITLATCACAGAAGREEAPIAELRGQLASQAAQIAAQQRRIDELEVKLAALSARASADPGAPRSAPSKEPLREPRPQLKTVKLSPRRPRANPVDRAPRLPAEIDLKEPDQNALAELDRVTVDPGIRREVEADMAFAGAVRRLNDGDLNGAEVDLLAFAGRYPRHAAADNALYLAGLVRQNRGDCAAAVALFERVPQEYPAGDAVPQALLEKGRCLTALQRNSEARVLLAKLVQEHPQAVEVTAARQLLQSLNDSGRH